MLGLHSEVAVDLLDEQPAVRFDLDLLRAELPGARQREEKGAVLGDVVGLVAERLEQLLGRDGHRPASTYTPAPAGPGLPRAAPSMEGAERPIEAAHACAVPVEDPLAAVAVDDLASRLQDLHRRGPDLHVARRAGAADTRTMARPAFFSTGGGTPRAPAEGSAPRARDLGARRLELLVDRALRRAPVLELLFVLLRLRRAGSLRAPSGPCAEVSISSSRARTRSSVAADELFDAVDLVQDGAVFAARLHVAQLRLVFLLLLLQIGELASAARRSSSASARRARSAPTASTFSRYSGRPPSALPGPCPARFRAAGRTGAGPGAGRADRGGPLNGSARDKEKGCPA